MKAINSKWYTDKQATTKKTNVNKSYQPTVNKASKRVLIILLAENGKFSENKEWVKQKKHSLIAFGHNGKYLSRFSDTEGYVLFLK